MKTDDGFVGALCMMYWGHSASPVSVGKDRFVALSPHGTTTGKCHVEGQAQDATGNGEARSGIELVQLNIEIIQHTRIGAGRGLCGENF